MKLDSFFALMVSGLESSHLYWFKEFTIHSRSLNNYLKIYKEICSKYKCELVKLFYFRQPYIFPFFPRKCVDLALEDVRNFLHNEGGQVSVSDIFLFHSFLVALWKLN